jgi:hypothetical protein
MTKSISSPSRTEGGRRAPARLDNPLRVLSSLTERDRWIIELIAEHQVFTTSQLAELAFVGLDTAQRRLVRLYRLGVLDRFRWHVAVGSINWHYTLGPIGAQLVAAGRDVDAPRPAEMRRRTMRLAGSPRLDHLLGCNGFFTALAVRARQQPGAALAEWWSEKRCAQHYGQIVRPDAYGAWVEDRRRADFFLEFDMGTETLGRLVDKFAGYADLVAAGGPAYPVLFWLPTAAREAAFHRLLDRPPVAVATASADLAIALEVGPAERIWLTAGAEHRDRLVGPEQYLDVETPGHRAYLRRSETGCPSWSRRAGSATLVLTTRAGSYAAQRRANEEMRGPSARRRASRRPCGG